MVAWFNKKGKREVKDFGEEENPEGLAELLARAVEETPFDSCVILRDEAGREMKDFDEAQDHLLRGN